MKPFIKGSYKEDDVIFLLQDISQQVKEIHTPEREKLIQKGIHYSEMLPVEYQPTNEYIDLFKQTLAESAPRIALSVGIVAEKILAFKQRTEKTTLAQTLERLVLVSLARAGTPIGILIKRYLQIAYQVVVPHYSISIIRGRGIDEIALNYIYDNNNNAMIQFIDGWTGKGAITQELAQACKQYNQKRNLTPLLSPHLAVLADTGHCTQLYGTREDFLIPSACLNSTVSGLVSRTVLNQAFIQPGEVHGAKYYQEFESLDVSNEYIETIMLAYLENKQAITQEIKHHLTATLFTNEPDWQGMTAIKQIQRDFHYSTIHFIKPGVGETTRVLLRRVPEKILIHPKRQQNLQHIFLLAKELNVPIEEYTKMPYSCCGLIKQQRGEKEI